MKTIATTRRGVLAASAAGLLQGCSPLQTFNTLAPRPAGARVAMRDVPYGAHPRQKLDIYRPSGSGPWPLLVFLYGGGWEDGSRSEYAFAGRAYAAHGFVTVVPDYRLTGEAAYPTFLRDCAAATAWAQAHCGEHGADTTRTVLAGHSAGAYNAAMLALDHRWLTEAGAPHRIAGWAGLSGPYDFLPLDPGPALRTFGGVADPASTQPITYVSPGDPPAFLAYGDKDQVVRPLNTRRLAARLSAAGVRVRERRYAGAGHADTVLALAWPLSLRLPVLQESVSFLHSTTGDRAQP